MSNPAPEAVKEGGNLLLKADLEERRRKLEQSLAGDREAQVQRTQQLEATQREEDQAHEQDILGQVNEQEKLIKENKQAAALLTETEQLLSEYQQAESAGKLTDPGLVQSKKELEAQVSTLKQQIADRNGRIDEISKYENAPEVNDAIHDRANRINTLVEQGTTRSTGDERFAKYQAAQAEVVADQDFKARLDTEKGNLNQLLTDISSEAGKLQNYYDTNKIDEAIRTRDELWFPFVSQRFEQPYIQIGNENISIAPSGIIGGADSLYFTTYRNKLTEISARLKWHPLKRGKVTKILESKTVRDGVALEEKIQAYLKKRAEFKAKQPEFKSRAKVIYDAITDAKIGGRTGVDRGQTEDRFTDSFVREEANEFRRKGSMGKEIQYKAWEDTVRDCGIFINVL